MSLGGRGTQKGPASYQTQNELDDVRRALNTAPYLPVNSCIVAELSAAVIAACFDATGKGKPNKVWSGWAIRNGKNGTVDVSVSYPRFFKTPAFTLGSPTFLAGTAAYEVPLKKIA